MNILFTICGRAGSKGFKNKNLKEMNGIPLVYYTLSAINLYMIKHTKDKAIVVLNTDSEMLIQLINRQNIVPVSVIPRKDELAGDTAAKVDVIKDTFMICISDRRDFKPDVVIDLDITSPMRRTEDIENAILEYSKGLYDVVFSVVEARRNPYFNMVEAKSENLYKKICESNYVTRQEAPDAYELNASIYAYSPAFLKSDIDKTILDYRCGIVVMPDYLVLDIDSECDFRMMSMLYNFYIGEDEGLREIYSMARKMTQNHIGDGDD